MSIQCNLAYLSWDDTVESRLSTSTQSTDHIYRHLPSLPTISTDIYSVYRPYQPTSTQSTNRYTNSNVLRPFDRAVSTVWRTRYFELLDGKILLLLVYRSTPLSSWFPLQLLVPVHSTSIATSYIGSPSYNSAYCTTLFTSLHCCLSQLGLLSLPLITWLTS